MLVKPTGFLNGNAGGASPTFLLLILDLALAPCAAPLLTFVNEL
jgi:hypothetical protein